MVSSGETLPSFVGVVVRVEDERPQRQAGIGGGRRDFADDGIKHRRDVRPVLGRDADHLGGRDPEQAANILGHFVGAGGDEVDLVDDRDDDQVRFEGLI
jgi:hypothetical protein